MKVHICSAGPGGFSHGGSLRDPLGSLANNPLEGPLRGALGALKGVTEIEGTLEGGHKCGILEGDPWARPHF